MLHYFTKPSTLSRKPSNQFKNNFVLKSPFDLALISWKSRLGWLSLTTESASTTTAPELSCCCHHVLGQHPRGPPPVWHSITTFWAGIKNYLLTTLDPVYSNQYNTKLILIILILFRIRLSATEKHDSPL